MKNSLLRDLLKSTFVFLFFSAFLACSQPEADLVIRSARIVTMDPNIPEARAVAVKGDRILEVGTMEAVSGYIGENTNVLEPEDALVIPGLIDSHAHFMSLGYSKLNLDLTRTRSFQDLVDSIAAVVKRSEKGEWIVGRGWHQERWDPAPQPLIDGYPVHDALSEVSQPKYCWLD